MAMDWDEILNWATLAAVSPYVAVALGEWVRKRLHGGIAGGDATK